MHLVCIKGIKSKNIKTVIKIFHFLDVFNVYLVQNAFKKCKRIGSPSYQTKKTRNVKSSKTVLYTYRSGRNI